MAKSSEGRSSAGIRLWAGQLGALIVKEFEQIWRDPSTWLVAGALPLLFPLLFGYGISLDAGTLRICLPGVGPGPAEQSIAGAFAHSPWFLASAPATIGEAEKMMRNAQSQAMLLFRPDFEAQEAAGQTGELALFIDGSEPNTARFMEMYSRRLLSQWAASPAARRKPRPSACRSASGTIPRPGASFSGARIHHGDHDPHRHPAHLPGLCPRMGAGHH